MMKIKTGGGGKSFKGFTLIELLAVIVILAIIALIATPLIMKVIEDARKNSAKDSAYGYIESVETSISTQLMNNPDSNYYGEYEISGNKLVGRSDEININSKGTKVDGTVYIENNIIKRAVLTTGGYDLTYYDSKAYVLGKSSTSPTTYTDGTAVYFNPETGKKCNESDAVSTHGTKTGCMKWYTFGDKEGSSTVKLLLDHNIANSRWINKTDYLAAGGTEEEWNKKTYTSGENTYPTGNTSKGPITVTKTLKSNTSTWKEELGARLITANEIAHITGNDTSNNWDSSKNTNHFYLGTNNQTLNKEANNRYAWVFDRLYSCENYGCNIQDNSAAWAYWTLDSWAGESWNAWDVNGNGTLNYFYPVNVDGVRPVIEVSKSIIS